MDYDDNDFQNQNLHLAAGEANSKFPLPYALPKFDFDDPHLRFDSLVGTEVFNGIEGNEDSNWIEDFSRGTSGIVFSSGANESCALSRHNDVWSEATSSESVEMLLNSVGQEQVIVRENTIKESDTSGYTMEQMEHEKSLSKEETDNLQPNPSVDETPGDSSVLKTQELALVKDDLPTVAEENDILATVEAVDPDKTGTETIDCLLDQTQDKAIDQTRVEVDCAADESSMEEKNAMLASDIADIEAQDATDGERIETETTDHLLGQTEDEANEQKRAEVDCAADESSMEEKNAILASDTEAVEAVDATDYDKRGTTDHLLSQTEEEANEQIRTEVGCAADESSMEERNAILASDTAVVEAADATEYDRIGTETTDRLLLGQTEDEASEQTRMEVDCREGTVQTLITCTGELNNQNPLLPETKDAVDAIAHAAEQVLPQQSEETISDENLVTEVAEAPEIQSTMDKNDINEKPNTSSLAHLGSDAGKDGQEEDKIVASVGIMTAGTLPSHDKVDIAGDAFEIRDSSASICSEPSLKFHVTGTESAATNLELQSIVDKNDINEKLNASSLANLGSDAGKDGQEEDKIAASVEITAAGTPVSHEKGDAFEIRDSGASTCSEPSLKSHVTGTESAATNLEIQSIVDKNDINEKPNTSSLADLGSDAGKDGQEEDKIAASVGIMTAGTLVSHGKVDIAGNAFEIRDSGASPCSEPSLKAHVTGTESGATNLGTPFSFPIVKTSNLQLNKSETIKKPDDDNKLKAEDQSILNLMSARSPMLNRNEVFGSGMNISDLRKAGDISKAVTFPEATLVSPVVVGSPSTRSLEKTPAKSAKAKSERKPRRTSKSAGKETSRKGSSVKGDTTPLQPFQSGGKTDGVNQNSACLFQITQSIEKQQSHQTPASKAFGTFSSFSTSTPSLPGLNTSALSSILRRPFTDLQQVQLRAQIFVYGALIQGTAPDEAYMISAFGGPDGEKSGWEKVWRACVVRAQKMHLATPETPAQSRAGKRETPSVSHTNSKETSATNPIIPLSSPLWSLSTSTDALQSSSMQRGSAAGHQPLLSSSHWVSPLPFRNPWLAPPQTSGSDVGSRFPVYPVTEPIKLTPMKESSAPYSGAKHVQSGTPSNVFKGIPTLEPTSAVVAPAPPSTSISRKRKKIPVSVEPTPNVLNSLKETELAVSPLLFGGNLVPGNLEVKQRYVLSADSIDKLNEAKMHAEDASALAAAAVSHSENVWKQINQQRSAGLQSETEGRLAAAVVAIDAAAAVAKAAAAAANVAASAAFQAKLMAEEAFLPSGSGQGNKLPKSNDSRILGQGAPGSILKGEGSAVSSSSVLIAAREASKKRVEAATAATKRAENMDSIVKAAELASEAVSQAGILVSMGHPPSLKELVEAGPSNYWRQAQEVQPSKKDVLEKETVATIGTSSVQTELVGGSLRTADGVSGSVAATEKKTKGQNGHKEPEVGSKSSIDTQTESGQIITRTTNEGDIKEGSNVDVFKEGPGIRSAWYSANVLGLEDDKAYVLFNELSVEQGTDKLKEWVALRGEGDKAPKIRTARSVTALPYEGTRKRRRAAIGDPVWKIGDKVDTWVHESWLEGVIIEKNKKDESTVTVHFPAQGDTLTIKAWNLRPSLEWKDGKWIECTSSSSSGGNMSSSHEGDTPKEKRPKFATPATTLVTTLAVEAKDTSMNPELAKPPQTGLLDLGVTENTFNIGRNTSRDENKPDPLRTKRTGLQKQGSKVFGVPKPGKKRKFMDVSKHYDSEASTKTQGERKEAANNNNKKPVKPIVPQPGGWRLPSKTVSREKQTTTTISKPTVKAKEKPATSRVIPRKDSDMESDDAADHQTAESKGLPVVSVPSTSSSTAGSKKGSSTTSNTSNKGKVGPTPSVGRLANIEEDKALAAADGMEPRRSNRRIQPTSRLLEGLQTSMMTSKIPSVSHNRSHQSQSKK